MSRKPEDYICFVQILFSVLCVNFVASQGIGCLFLRDDQSIRCQNTSFQDVSESLHILTMVVHNKPQIVDIDYCGGANELSPIFSYVNASIDTVRIRRSGLKTVHLETFAPLARSLRDLDLSHNMLTTIPEAVSVLWALEHLNLQHNRIVFVRPGSLFDGMPSLREINLANNYLGLNDENINTENHHYQLKGNLGLEVFNLGKSIHTLESLNVRGNKLAAVPDQIANSSLPELRHLDLSENVIGHLDDISSTILPKIEFLDVHSNRIQSLNFYSLPITIQYLDITENPFHCDCAALWLFDWYIANTTTLRLPTCNSPDSLRGIDIWNVEWARHCPADNVNYSFRYMNKESSQYDVIQLLSSTTAISISWKVRMDNSNKKWRVVYRRETDNPYQMTLSTPSQRSGKANDIQETVFSDKIQNLQESTVYIVCIAVIQNEKYTIEQNRCEKIKTKGDRELDSKGEDQKTFENVRTELEDISVTSASITLRWKLIILSPFSENEDTESIRHEWTLRIRRTGSDNYTDIPVFDITTGTQTNEQMYEYGIMDLAPRTHYDICLLDVDHSLLSDASVSKRIPPEVMGNESTCRTVVTSGTYVLYAAEIAAICLACAICVIVVVVTVHLCRQKQLIKWKPKLLTEWLCHLSRNERPQPIGCNNYATASIPRVNCPSKDSLVENKACIGTWSTLRMPYKEFPQIDGEFPPAESYKEALSTVTIFRSGHSEC